MDRVKSVGKGLISGHSSTGDESQSLRAANHNSTPLSALRDPSEFAPPPKHRGPVLASASTPVTKKSTKPDPSVPREKYGFTAEDGTKLKGAAAYQARRKQAAQLALQAPTPADSYDDTRDDEPEEEEEYAAAPRQPPRAIEPPSRPKPSLPTRTLTPQTSGPPPSLPARAISPQTSGPAPPLPSRTTISPQRTGPKPSLPVRPSANAPPSPSRFNNPSIPPRLNTSTPGLPPRRATQDTQEEAAPPYSAISPSATKASSRLAAAGVSVPGLDIGHRNDEDSPAQSGGFNDIQARIAALTTNSISPNSAGPGSLAAVAAKKKPPPPVAPKKPAILQGHHVEHSSEPPPLPMSTKPKFS